MEVSSEQSPEDTGDQNSFFVNSEGLKLHCKYWYPESNDPDKFRAAVFICHGAGEHCQTYAKLASMLTERNMFVFAHDHVGHGLSEGDRMHVSKFSTYVDDSVQHVNIVRNNHPNIPIIAIGHSMGGAIILKAVLDDKDLFAGLVLLAPALIICPRLLSTSAVAAFFVRTFARIFPQAQLKAISPDLLSRDPEIVKEYREDPLVWHGGAKAKWLICFVDTLTELRSRFGEITCPFYVQQGTDDKICDAAGSQMLYDIASSTNKRLKMYPDAYHQLHSEPNGQGEEAAEDTVNWITDLLASAAFTPEQEH